MLEVKGYVDLGGGISTKGYVPGFIDPNAPVVDNPIDDQSIINACLLWEFTFPEDTFSDPEMGVLTYTAELANGDPLPGWMTFNPLTRTFSGEPLVGDHNPVDIKVIATDPQSLSVSEGFVLNVLEAVKSGGGIISKMRKQNAIYWPPGKAGDYGKQIPGALRELIRCVGVSNYRVRWEDKVEEFVDDMGTIHRSKAMVFVPIMWDGTELEVGGYLWLGDRENLTDEIDPQKNKGAREVKRMDILPNIKSNAFLRTAYL